VGSNQILHNDKVLQMLFVGGLKMCPANPRLPSWKLKTRDNSATVWPILIKYVMVMQLGTVYSNDCQNFKLLEFKSKMASILEVENLQYLCKVLSNVWWNCTQWLILGLPNLSALKILNF